MEKEIIIKNGKRIDEIKIDNKLLSLIAFFIRLLREDENLEKKPSVRASIGLYERAQSNALVKGKKEVSFEDIKEAVISVLSHRIRLKPSVKYLQTPKEYVEEKFEKETINWEEELEKAGCL